MLHYTTLDMFSLCIETHALNSLLFSPASTVSKGRWIPPSTRLACLRATIHVTTSNEVTSQELRGNGTSNGSTTHQAHARLRHSNADNRLDAAPPGLGPGYSLLRTVQSLSPTIASQEFREGASQDTDAHPTLGGRPIMRAHLADANTGFRYFGVGRGI